MLQNRSIPDVSVIPVLYYDNVEMAASWLCDVFGFAERLRIGNHRIQLTCGSGALVVADRPARQNAQREGGAPLTHSMMVRVENADAHYAHAVSRGAQNASAPINHPYGERQYSVTDFAGHAWTFTETIADVDPASWGGVLSPSARL